MTELEKLYAAARVNHGGMGHHAALRHVAAQTGIDAASVDRALKRAKRADAVDSRREAQA